jgi:hypothetical protein
VADSQEKTASVELLEKTSPLTAQATKVKGKGISIDEPPTSNPPVPTASAFLQNVSCFKFP